MRQVVLGVLVVLLVVSCNNSKTPLVATKLIAQEVDSAKANTIADSLAALRFSDDLAVSNIGKLPVDDLTGLSDSRWLILIKGGVEPQLTGAFREAKATAIEGIVTAPKTQGRGQAFVRSEATEVVEYSSCETLKHRIENGRWVPRAWSDGITYFEVFDVVRNYLESRAEGELQERLFDALGIEDVDVVAENVWRALVSAQEASSGREAFQAAVNTYCD